MSKPFKVCDDCGSPILDGNPLAVVVYFKTERDKAEFMELVNEELGFNAYGVDDAS